MEKQEKYPQMKEDKRRLMKWLGRIVKNKIQGRKYTLHRKTSLIWQWESGTVTGWQSAIIKPGGLKKR